MGEYRIAWGSLMAGFLIITVPAILIFGFLQKNLVKGISAGAVKG